MKLISGLAFILALPLAACSPAVPDTTERTGLVTMKGEPITLEGRGVKVGEIAPDFVAVAIDLSEQRLSEYRGLTVILSCVPSLESAVCDRETRTFNEKALALPENAVVLTVSMDQPSVQKRWCGTRGIVRVITLSDARHGEVGRAFGLLMRENGRLARAVYVIDAKGVIRYEELVKEVATEPNYAAAMAAAQNAAIGH
jgi:thiol peroxidase